MRNHAKAQLIHFVQIGNQEIGYISIAELARDVPFEVQRIFWTYDTPTGVLRGKHGHKETEIVLVAVKGSIKVMTEDIHGNRKDFLLDDPSIGLYLPPQIWHTMTYSNEAIQLALASTPYDEADYLRTKGEFISFWKTKINEI